VLNLDYLLRERSLEGDRRQGQGSIGRPLDLGHGAARLGGYAARRRPWMGRSALVDDRALGRMPTKPAFRLFA